LQAITACHKGYDFIGLIAKGRQNTLKQIMQEKYVPSPEEEGAARNSMTPEQESRSFDRESTLTGNDPDLPPHALPEFRVPFVYDPKWRFVRYFDGEDWSEVGLEEGLEMLTHQIESAKRDTQDYVDRLEELKHRLEQEIEA
jgi:hypothetical protein